MKRLLKKSHGDKSESLVFKKCGISSVLDDIKNTCVGKHKKDFKMILNIVSYKTMLHCSFIM